MSRQDASDSASESGKHSTKNKQVTTKKDGYIMNSFECKIVRTDGEIDIQATLTSVEDFLSSLSAREANDNEVIAVEVQNVWDEHPGMKGFQLGVLAAYTMEKLRAQGKVPAAEYETIQERVKDYVRNTTNLFHIAKGKGGGVLLLSRLSTEELAKVEAQRAKEAAKVAATGT